MQPTACRLFCRAANKIEMDIQKVVKLLNKFAPLNHAGTWDNVGLLVHPPSKKSVSCVLLTNDLTEEVLDEAVANKSDFILSYHPPIFKALKSITTTHWKERIVGRCIESGIAIYSPHTAYDAMPGGVNDWLAGGFGSGLSQAIDSVTVSPPKSYQIQLHCGYDTTTLVTFLKEMETATGNSVMSNESHIFCNQKELLACTELLSQEKYDCFEYTITKCENIPVPRTGYGRLVKLQSRLTISDVVKNLKQMTGMPQVRLALGCGHTMDSVVSQGAVCAGSGISILKNVNADVLVSGEMSHHDVLDLAQSGRTVILLEHSNSERGFLRDVLQGKLRELFENKVEVLVSEKDRDPLQFV